jgi:SAM-dependent methyltransferase
MQPYTQDFFKSVDEESLRSARAFVPLVMDLIQPKRVIDLGCGLGNWLSVFKEYGVEEILGVDGDYIDLDLLKIPQKYFLQHDLKKPLKVEQHFDLVVSLEVAEHLPSESAENFVDTLVSLGSVILFSAALPYQPGNSHLNGQWPDYWVSFFHNRGYTVCDCLRNKVWQNENVEWWYSQNIFLFVKETELEKYPLLQQEFAQCNKVPLSLVHPKLYLLQQAIYQSLQESFDPNKMSIRQAGFLFLSVLKTFLKKSLSRNFS